MQIHGVPVFVCTAEGEMVRTEGDAVQLAVDAGVQDAEWVVLPTERLDDAFFELRTGMAGGILQKFAMYRMRLAVVGDISAHTEDSTSFRDMVRETNRGSHTWFGPSLDDFRAKLAQGTRTPERR